MEALEIKKEWKERTLDPGVKAGIASLIARQQTSTAGTLKPESKLSNQPVLFYGPAGAGKKMSASLMGEALKKEVYRIDLSQVVSKYIGETEKNLSKIFDTAANKNWILFFDEADALFGKRIDVKDAHDKYANQEIAYLLTLAEKTDAWVVIAFKDITIIDPDLLKRFQTVVTFPEPPGK